VEWTLENATTEPYDFAIILHTIGQASAARDKIEAETVATKERDKRLAEERAKEDLEEQQRKEIVIHKASLGAKARAELMTMDVPDNMITDLLVDIKENGGLCISPRKGTFQKCATGIIICSAL
jgi:hypothetical protein